MIYWRESTWCTILSFSGLCTSRNNGVLCEWSHTRSTWLAWSMKFFFVSFISSANILTIDVNALRTTTTTTISSSTITTSRITIIIILIINRELLLSYSSTSLDRLRALQEVQASRVFWKSAAAGDQLALSTGCLYPPPPNPKRDSPVLISVRGQVVCRAILRPEKLSE